MSKPHQTVIFDSNRFPKAGELYDAVHDQPGRYKVIICVGSIRSGKSYAIGGVLMTLHRRYPYSRSIVVRDSLTTLEDTTLGTVEKLIPPSFVKKQLGRPKYQWTFTNGSKFQFFSEMHDDDPDRKRWDGLEVNFIWLEQAEGLQEITFNKAMERFNSYFVPSYLGEQPPGLIIISLNVTDTWARMFHEMDKAGTLPDDWKLITFYLNDNSALPESYVKGLELLKEKDPVRYAQYVLVDWDARPKNGQEWLHKFDRKVHMGEVPYLREHPTYLTFDFNSVPYMTMLCAQIIEKGNGVQVRFYQEYCLPHPKNRSKDCIEEWSKDYPEKRGHTAVWYTGDASGHNRIPGFGDLTAFIEVAKTLKALGYWHNTSDMVYREGYQNAWVRDFVNDILSGEFDIEVVVDEKNCPTLVRDLEQTPEDMGGGPFKKKVKDPKTGVIYEENGHCTDAFKTLFLGVWKQLFKPYKKRRRDALNVPDEQP